MEPEWPRRSISATACLRPEGRQGLHRDQKVANEMMRMGSDRNCRNLRGQVGHLQGWMMAAAAASAHSYGQH